ncbi:MAG: DUF4388 domain-containing protein [Thermoanaerobaculia bacterium]
MSISGSLEDVAVGDVFQFIHLGRRTGTLELERLGEHARFGFLEGKLIAAQAPGAPRLGELLLERGHVDATALARAMAEQATGMGKLSLGQILVQRRVIAVDLLERLVTEQLERSVATVMSWGDGSFDFALDEMRQVDDIGVLASELIAPSELSTDVVLLEAARIFDERDRRGAPVDPLPEDTLDELIGPAEEAPGAGAEPAARRVRAITPDRDFARQLQLALGPGIRLRRVALGRAAEPDPSGAPPVLLVDARAGAVEPEALDLLRRAQPAARVVALVDSAASLQAAYRHGALAAVPAEIETVRSCLVNLLAEPGGDNGEEIHGAEGGMRRLQRIFGELRSGLVTATVALNLMSLVSESFERAVLLLLRQDRLAALGAFGVAATGKPLAESVRRLEIPASGAIGRAIDSGEVETSAFAAAGLDPRLAAILGPPANDRVVIFPVAGSERAIAVVYADNGALDRPVRDVEILELATAQVGIAFENELLRRQLGIQRS